MNVRRATMSDLEDILSVYAAARIYMSEHENPTQWGASYPPVELVVSDIEGGLSWVITDICPSEDKETVLGVFAFLPDGDPIYNNIEGKWLNDLPHAAIHRVASSGERRGILGACIDFCISRSDNLKIDTHRDNITMQNALKKQGFVACGRIFLENGEDRIAYQRVVSDSGRSRY